MTSNFLSWNHTSKPELGIDLDAASFQRVDFALQKHISWFISTVKKTSKVRALLLFVYVAMYVP